MLKFAHMADIHLDSPFHYLGNQVKQDERRSEQRNIFKKAIKSAYDNSCEFVLISGDLFDGEIADISTIKYIDEVVSIYDNMKVIIIAGNHDLINNNILLYSYNFNSKNVVVLSNNNPFIELENVRIYGYISEDILLDSTYYNILMWHGDVNESGQENPLPSKYKKIGFNYIALGHIHQYENHSNEVSKIYYPGNLIARGFDELNEKGYLLVNFDKQLTEVSFVEVKQRKYISKEIDISNIDYENVLVLSNEIATHIDDPSNFYVITLKGNRNTTFKVNKTYLDNELENKAYYIKVKDKTTYNEIRQITPIEQEFINKIDRLINNCLTDEEKEKYRLAKLIGLKALRNEVIYDEDM